MKCNDEFGCGRDTPSLFTVAVRDFGHEDSDEDGLVEIKVCRDCAATGDWSE